VHELKHAAIILFSVKFIMTEGSFSPICVSSQQDVLVKKKILRTLLHGDSFVVSYKILEHRKYHCVAHTILPFSSSRIPGYACRL